MSRVLGLKFSWYITLNHQLYIIKPHKEDPGYVTVNFVTIDHPDKNFQQKIEIPRSRRWADVMVPWPSNLVTKFAKVPNRPGYTENIPEDHILYPDDLPRHLFEIVVENNPYIMSAVHLPKDTVPFYKHRISHEEYEKNSDHDCPICMNTYTLSNSVETPCNHSFCMICFSSHCRRMDINNQDINCPLCRQDVHYIRRYRKEDNKDVYWKENAHINRCRELY